MIEIINYVRPRPKDVIRRPRSINRQSTLGITYEILRSIKLYTAANHLVYIYVV